MLEHITIELLYRFMQNILTYIYIYLIAFPLSSNMQPFFLIFLITVTTISSLHKPILG